MKFVDEASVSVSAGKGGNGCLSFLRRANIAKGGPDGGNGGNGGSVILVGDSVLNTLIDFQYQPLLKAGNGAAGGSSQKKGANGETLRVPVPCGTTVIDDETLELIGDVIHQDQELCVAVGGRSGRGNASFKSSTNRSPRQTTEGAPGEHRRIRLQLRVLADVGLLGLPNAGKSTLLNVVTASRPKIAEYPFTTLEPTLGVVRSNSDQSFVMADIPGLIQGSAEGKGLGTRFLRHLSRNSLLLHLVEVSPIDGSDPLENLLAIEEELQRYSKTLTETPIFTVLTKIDTVSQQKVDEVLNLLERARPDRSVFAISSVTNRGVDSLLNFLGARVATERSRLESDTQHRAHAREKLDTLASEIMQQSLEERRRIRSKKKDGSEEEVEVIYRRE